MKLRMCEKCGRLYDNVITYDPANYSLPRYGVRKIGLCHRCRTAGTRVWEPRPGKRWDIAKYLRDNNATITSSMYAEFGYKTSQQLSSTLSQMRAANILEIKKGRGLKQYRLTPEYRERLEGVEV